LEATPEHTPWTGFEFDNRVQEAPILQGAAIGKDHCKIDVLASPTWYGGTWQLLLLERREFINESMRHFPRIKMEHAIKLWIPRTSIFEPFCLWIIFWQKYAKIR
jgi:hypothetical protein